MCDCKTRQQDRPPLGVYMFCEIDRVDVNEKNDIDGLDGDGIRK